jgi:ribonuclease P protein component
VLPAAARLTSSESLRRCVREGRRAGSRTVVVHLLSGAQPTGTGDHPAQARVGFVVGRTVGGAVVRNRLRRRLRHLVRERLAELPGASVVVVRALAGSGDATYGELREDLGRCLDRVLPATRTVTSSVPTS